MRHVSMFYKIGKTVGKKRTWRKYKTKRYDEQHCRLYRVSRYTAFLDSWTQAHLLAYATSPHKSFPFLQLR